MRTLLEIIFTNFYVTRFSAQYCWIQRRSKMWRCTITYLPCLSFEFFHVVSSVWGRSAIELWNVLTYKFLVKFLLYLIFSGYSAIAAWWEGPKTESHLFKKIIFRVRSVPNNWRKVFFYSGKFIFFLFICRLKQEKNSTNNAIEMSPSRCGQIIVFLFSF